MNKFLGIEFLRGLSAIWVMLFHYKQVYPDTSYSYGILDPLISKGGLGVEMFFVLSGFIMHVRYKPIFSSRVNNLDYKDYLIKRIARIWPLHAFCTASMVFGAYLAHFFFSADLEDARFNFFNVLLSLSLASFYFDSVVDINMPAWTLSAELFAYALLPIIFFVNNLKPGKYLILGLVIVFTIYPLNESIDAGFRLMWGYTVGIFCAEFVYLKARNSIKFVCALAAFLVYSITESYVSLLLLFGLFVTILCGVDASLLKRPMIGQLAIWFGKLSFPVYIVHWPVRTYIRTAVEISGLQIPDGAMILLYTLISLFLAYALHLLLEEPARKFIIERFAKQPSSVLN